jgi:hypothetical protein
LSPLPPFKEPKRPPTRRSHLERLVNAYARDTDIPQARLRHRISSLALIGALQRVQDPNAGPRRPRTVCLRALAAALACIVCTTDARHAAPFGLDLQRP